MLRGAKVLVAGGTGFLGTHLALRLVREGASVRATRRQRPVQITDPAIEYVEADLRRPEDCARAVAGMEFVLMCAANTSGAAVMRTDPLAHVSPNVVMNAHILEAAYRAGVKKFLFISSGAAYPPTGARPVAEHEMFDADPYDGYFAVAWMKRYAEVLCRTYAEKIPRRMATCVVRPSNVFGPWDKYDFATSHVTAATIRRVAERQSPIEMWGTGEDVRDLIYIDDFVEGLLRAFQRPEDYYVVNICSGTGVSVKQILEVALRVDGYMNADVRFDPAKPSTIPVRLIDGSKAARELGFTPKVSLEEGLRRTLAWYKKHHLGMEPPTAS